MNREDCEKLLDSYEIIVSAEVNLGSGTAEGLNLEIAHDSLREVIVGVMAGERKPAYKNGGIVVKNAPLQWTENTSTIPPHVTKPVITCDGKGEITARD